MAPKRLTCEEFKQRAILVHGDKYDYSQTEYINMQHKVRIICLEHGSFDQLPQAHLRGQGCPVCGQEKQQQTMMDKYGADNAMKIKQFYDKARETSLEKYGHRWAMSCPEIHQKVVDAVRERYGVDYPYQSPEIQRKAEATMLAHYGSTSWNHIPEIRAKARATCLRKYGSEQPLASPVIREKIKATNFERYGGPAPMSSPDIQAKAQGTYMDKYGVPFAVMSPEVISKTRDSKRERGTFSSSGSEDRLYEMLLNHFDASDIFRNYKSDVYPFACDFYIKSRDLYIELNGLWTHGSYWFDVNSQDDQDMIATWAKRGTKYYKNAIHVWTVADVNKRNMARANNLNYIVFWDSNLRDAEIWFAMNCPDGRDWDESYSWMK